MLAWIQTDGHLACQLHNPTAILSHDILTLTQKGC